ncbi:tRNA (cytosine(34)-C(5))-methyltransferase-like [Limulus polyphemus]|uniref:tRNA (cytosine(34)-C(5))-methyltransferase n=1 Tax=Limulus polyphemus TaxID=6850 RepID=A0ABM1SWK9_LIMPO|nr:tRNA (cytosine(34)-C(5))-methyltransferase-like [Limulus polyphemus]XP_022248015.1 tRNA (cytosine(34)-C(5))-methyltransferase-like [Limulus polyphemus]XP_022248016.1 tRNA (cytosine(34)-C(5))-methyltransferase-like [Limulus polyphemus]XP_022248017.1 tRNA (cytosine(34)-C(5))-methyltransferase-like [Limulus polyphemus]
MGKRSKRQKQVKASTRYPAKNTQMGKREGYSDIVMKNEAFEMFYKAQKIVSEDEWDTFLSSLKDTLPVTFRITGFKAQAKALLKIIQSQYFHELLDVEVEGERVESPLSLSWYPDKLAWQLKISRKIIRKSEEFERLHSFLISETESGNISRQEAVSMIPPLLLDIKPHHKILDMCAAPGSKTAQIIEMLHKEETGIPGGVVVANDMDNKRCYMLVHQAKRLHSPCCIVTNHDASQMPNLRVKTPTGKTEVLKYNRILCDVPCSGDGTLRKNIDIWRKWNVAHGNNLNGLQLRIAKRGLELLQIGGLMVYSTCSLNPIENEAVIAALLLQCEGSVELLDVTEKLPGLKTSPGLNHWNVMTRELEVFENYENVPERSRTQIRPHMFPPSPELLEKLHLHRCIRIFPHHQDTGAFFVAVLQKKVERLPWEPKIVEKDHSEMCSEGNDADTSEPKMMPPRKKKRVWGYKEDPFLFFRGDENAWNEVKDFYNLKPTFPYAQLLSRCQLGKMRNIYFVSEAAKQIVENNSGHVKIVNTGVKVFSRIDNKDTKCGFRLCQEGIPTIMPFVQSRCLRVCLEDLKVLLTEEYPLCFQFSEETQKTVQDIDVGCVALIHTANKGTEEEFSIELCGWRGKTSLRCYVSRNERIHYLRICGIDISSYEKREKKFKAKPTDKTDNSSNERASTDGLDVVCGSEKEDLHTKPTEVDLEKESDDEQLDDEECMA